uniref:hypothetical protein n=1 Tax=uncultured Tenacibaculum sp. TaxID=174713 RepID=UPI00261C98CD|nr:hypothetical protein [uncultured Tenacibaculum sp.]
MITQSKFLIVFFLFFIFYSCSSPEQKVTIVQKPNLTDSDIKIKVLTLKQYEYDSHKIFQESLYDFSDIYIKKQSNKFVENETGFFTILSEIFNWGDSETKRKIKWKSRVEKYFKPSQYSFKIQEKKSDYTRIINKQREELLNFISANNQNKLKLKDQPIEINLSDKTLNEVVNDINKLILTEIIPEVIEALLIPITLSLLGVFISLFFKEALRVILFIICVGATIWFNYKFSTNLENKIHNEFKIKDKSHLKVLNLLNENTKNYYNHIEENIK